MKKRNPINRGLSKLKRRLFRNEINEIRTLKEKVKLLEDCNVVLRSITGANFEQDYLSSFKYLIEEQRRLTNEVLYNYIEEQKSIERENFTPKVTIVMPVFFKIKEGSNDQQEYLMQSIKSIEAQTYDNIEGIIVNDGCEDEESRLLEEVIECVGGNRIRYFKKENGGTSAALNFGIEHMTGDYFAWLSHDDLFYPDHIQVHIQHLRKTSPDEKIITNTMVNIIDENSNIMIMEELSESFEGKDYKRSLLGLERSYNVPGIGGCSVLLPKHIFDTIGRFDEDARVTHEYELWRRIEETYQFFTIPKYTHAYRVHDNSEHSRIEHLMDTLTYEKIEILKNISKSDIEKIYGSRVNFLHKLKPLYYDPAYQDILDYLNESLHEEGYDR
jgi:glycosyltransferase involved in cell wall biosynthesis